VSERLGIDQGTLYQYETGRRAPSTLALIGLATIYETPVSWLLEEAPEPEENSVDLEEVSLTSLRIIGAISAGGFIDGWESDLGLVEVPTNVRRQAPRSNALRVSGNSLAASGIFDGDIVVVDPDAHLIEGLIYAVRSEAHNQSIAARHVYDVGRRRLKLVSGDGEVVEVERSRTDILGRVRWSFREH
jgi:SOS-response transcriptional repressor LexA